MIRLFIFAVLVVMVVADYKPLTTEELYAVGNYTKDTPQYLWELSGQYGGDMVYTRQQIAEKLSKNGIVDTRYHWPNKKLIVELDPSITIIQQLSIKIALNTLVAGTCVSWAYRTPTDVDYVYVTNQATGCWSSVGRIGGKQQLNLQDPGCWRCGIIAHEFLHAFGFYHMESTPERDSFVQIHWLNVMSGMEVNFDKGPFTSFGYPYDYDNIMHSSAYAFAINSSLPTMTRLAEPYYKLGSQDCPPTLTDILKLSTMYGCS